MRRRIPGLLGLALIYFAAGKLGLRLAFVTESTTAVWPAAGIALGAMLLFGPRTWPAIAAGAFLVNLTTSGHPYPALAIAAGNTLECVIAWWLVVRFAGGTAAFEHPPRVFAFATLAGMGSTIVAATIGTAALLFAGEIPREDMIQVWITWWIGDGVGIILITPLIVLAVTRPPERWTPARLVETAAVLVAVAFASWLVFGASPLGTRQFPLTFLAVPVLLWPAFRLGATEAAVATVLLSGVAIGGTLAGVGPFVRGSPNESLLFVQAFSGIWMTAFLAVSIEVAVRRRAEAAVRALNETLERRVIERTEEASRMHERLALAQRVASVGSWEWDIARDTIWWSDELFRIFRVPSFADRTYENYLTLLHPDDRLRVESAVGKALADGRPFSFEHRLLWPDGTVRTIQADGHVELDAAGKPIRMIGTARDITGIRRAEDERIQRIREQAARLEAEDASRAKDEFLATLSHELRTPLNAALGWAFMLRDTIDTPDGRRRALDTILRNLQAQSRLVSDMMDVSHITLRTLRLRNERVEMGEVVRLAIESVRTLASSGQVVIDAALPADPIYVTGDGGRLQQVVWNLVSNAVKFTGEGGAVRVGLCVDKEHRVRLVVEDDGPGIDPSFLPHLFERFRQADSSVTREHGGLGLGLAITRHIVEAHGGTVTAANRADGGAVFTVCLPCAGEAAGR